MIGVPKGNRTTYRSLPSADMTASPLISGEFPTSLYNENISMYMITEYAQESHYIASII